MNGRLILRVVLALLMVGVIAIILRSALAPSEPVKTAPPKVVAAFAAIDMPQGLLIRPQDLTWVDLPADAQHKGQIVQGSPAADQLSGAVVRHAIASGEPITSGSVVLPSSPGFLSAALKPDMRAVSVPIDEVSGNAGLILPGDYVDLILTQTVGREGRSEHRIVSETVLSNVRIIAVGRSLKVERDPNGDDGVMASAKARTTTLEVRPSEAEVVAVAARLGTLSLALRSLATLQRPGETEALSSASASYAPVPVWAEDVSTARRQATAPESDEDLPPALPPVVRVIRGSGNVKDIEGNDPVVSPSTNGAPEAAALR